jgi:hypothetical protein
VRARGRPETIHGRGFAVCFMLARTVTMRSARLPALLGALFVLAGTPVLAIAADSVKDGAYSGSVGPGYPLGFRVETHGTEVKDLVLGFDAGCNGAPAEVAPLFHFATLKIKGDKLTGSTSRSFSSTVTDVLHIDATFSGDHLSGKVTVDQSITSLGTCSEADTLTAKLK